MIRFKKKLLFILALGLLVRLYKVNTPLADWHSFRQADTASVTREYVKHGVDLLHPKYQDLSNIQSGMQNAGKDNIEGWRMVEFPLVNGVLALILRAIPSLDLVIVSRLASIFASLVSIVSLSLLVRRFYTEKTALLTAFVFATLPYSVYYSRTILPEPFFIASSLLSLVFFSYSYRRKNIALGLLSAGVFAVALLIKPMAIFFIPVFLAIWWKESHRVAKREILLGFAFLLSTIPLLWWRKWIMQFPLGIPSSDWLYNGGGPQYALSPVYRVRYRPAWFRWIFYERLSKLFLGYFGVAFFAAGSIRALVDRSYFFFAWAIGALAYVTVFAAGNVQHDYYQAPLVPFVSIAVALGIVAIYRILKSYLHVTVATTVCVFLMLGMCVFAWQQVKGYYNINNWDIVTAGKAADTSLPPDAKVIAPYQGDTAFLFQINRTGWPIGFDIDTKIKEGAAYYVSVNYDDEARALETKYVTVEKNSKYIILDLTMKKADQ